MQSTNCNFCTLGCAFELSENNAGLLGIKYSTSGHNKGRLCSRGNAIPLCLYSDERLCSPLLSGNAISWEEAFSKIIHNLKEYQGNQVAVTYDTNITQEEYSLIFDFAKALGTKNVASSYLEPEHYFNYELPGVKTAIPGDFKNNQVFLLVGDVFSQFPVIAKLTLESKYCDKNHKILVIDSIVSSTASFADVFIRTEPGKEALALLDLVDIIKAESPDGTASIGFTKSGIEKNLLEQAAKSLKDSDKAIVIAASSFGKTGDPILFSGAAQYLASSLAKGEKKFLWLGESDNLPGEIDFSEMLSKINNGEIRCLLNFGTLSPLYYPQVWQYLDKIDFVASTAAMQPNNNGDYLSYLFLPTTLLPETGGTIHTFLEGKKKVYPLVTPMSGVKPLSEIINKLADDLGLKLTGTHHKPSSKKLEIKEIIERAGKISFPESEFKLVGEKQAYSFKGLFEKPKATINPEDAGKLGLKENSTVELKSASGEIELKATISDRIPAGIISVPAEIPEIRVLFGLKIDSEVCEFAPVEVNICKKD